MYAASQTPSITPVPDPAPVALELRGVEKRFGPVAALARADFRCLAGEVHALMGENGAGKSTMMRIVAGILAPSAGQILVDGAEVVIDSPRRAAELGIAMVHQDTRLVPDLDVARNIWLGHEPGGPILTDAAAMQEGARRLVARLGVEIDPRRLVRDLSVAERQAVEIARALTIDPKVLILDEPTSALDGAEIAGLFAIIRRLKAGGAAVVFISHRLPEVFEIADRMTVLKDGVVMGTVDRADVTNDGLVAMMVGRAVELAYPPRPDRLGSVRVRMRGLAAGQQFQDVTLDVRAGEILGLGGIQGNGQAEVARALFGLVPFTGELLLDGEAVGSLTPRSAIGKGIVYVPGDRHKEGLFLPHSIRENTTLPHLRAWAGLGVVPRGREIQATDAAMTRFATKAAGREAAVSTLSGGNQQKVVLGRWTTGEPKVFVFEDPTRGVDVGTKLEIYRQVRALAAGGAAVILVASDLMELIGLSDRIAVFSRGRVVDELPASEATEERIVGGAAGARDARAGTGRAARRAVGPPRARSLFWDRYAGAVFLTVLIVALGAVAGRMSEFFLTGRNLANVATQIAPLALAALGQFVVILVRGIDLSVGPLISLITAVASFLAVGESGADTALTIVACLGIGVAAGVLNATLAVWLRIPDLIATLSSYSVIYGLALIVRPAPGGLLSMSFIDGLSYAVAGVPLAVAGVVLLYVLAEVLLQRGRIGQRLYATGSAPEAGAVVGISPGLVRALAYVFCGVTAAAAGLLLSARIGSGDPQAGAAFTLSSVTAVVIGGASVLGGRGTAVATLLGAVAVGIMQNALNLMHVSAYWQYIWTGLLTLVAVSVYSLRFRRTGGGR